MIMLTITSLKMWRDPGYTQGCLEIPPAGSTLLPAPDWQSSGPLRPRKGSTLTAVELPLPYTEVWEMCYLHMIAEDGSGEMEVYGWVNAVTITASSADAVRIDWTPDWWRTCSGRAVWGAGRIVACSDASRRRPIGTQPRYRTASTIAEIRSDPGAFSGSLLWLIMTYRDTDSRRLIAFFPMSPDGHTASGESIRTQDPLSSEVRETGKAPSWLETLSGALPSLLGLQSTAIDGAWLSPMPPLLPSTYEIVKEGAVIWFSVNTFMAHIKTHDGKSMFVLSDVGDHINAPPYAWDIISLDTDVSTDDKTVYAITDTYGNIVGVSPYSLPVHCLISFLDIGSISCSLKVVLAETGSLPVGEICGLQTSEGRTITVPLPTVPISSHASSDYMLSGQRDYEMQLRELQSERQAVNGISGVATGAIGGAIVGSVVPGAGTALGALAGGIGSALGVGMQYLADTQIYNDRFRDLEDRRYANQSGNLMIAGDGSAWLRFMIYPSLVALTADDVSSSDMDNFIAQQGYPCDSPVDDVGPFVAAGGPLRINNLTITGDMPPAAKRSIKALLAGGVRIIERNGGTS